MPIYEYFCTDCHTKFEALRPMAKADEPIACTHCAGTYTTRVLSMFFAHAGGTSSPANGESASTSSTGGCCGGSCGCHGHG